MKTILLCNTDSQLQIAAQMIKDGLVVGIPTETVYGLGADASNEEAVRCIFAAKGRPADNPLIVHLANFSDAKKYTSNIPDLAYKLADLFCPGPLTIVLPKNDRIPLVTSGGLDTVGIRIPSHPVIHRLIELSGKPIAAPSANISKHVSPVSAEHVYHDLNGKIKLILDGGKSEGGIESTVLDCTGEIPTILRSGLVTKEQIENAVGRCGVYQMKEGEAARSPGMKYKHYSPDCRTQLYDFNEIALAVEEYKKQTANGVKTYIMCDNKTANIVGVENILNLGNDENEIASNLYLKLREGEKIAQLIIAIAPEKQDGVMVGVMNRLTKACKSQ